MPAYKREFRFRDSRFFVVWVPDFVGKGDGKEGDTTGLKGEMERGNGRGKCKGDVVGGNTSEMWQGVKRGARRGRGGKGEGGMLNGEKNEGERKSQRVSGWKIKRKTDKKPSDIRTKIMKFADGLLSAVCGRRKIHASAFRIPCSCNLKCTGMEFGLHRHPLQISWAALLFLLGKNTIR